MRRLLWVVVIAFIGASCGTEGGAVVTTSPTTSPTTASPDPSGGQLVELVAARQQWFASAPADYTVAARSTCDGCDAVAGTVAVRGGELASLRPDAALAPIDAAFEEIERSILQGAEVDVVYDDGLGYPTRVIIDRNGDGTVDLALEFADLEAMPIVETLAELQRARERWESLALDTYRYLFRADCTCPEGGTIEVEVRNGSVYAVVPLDERARSGALVPGPIDEAFDDLELWFTDSGLLIEEGILAVDVRMDPELGYPRWFEVSAADLDDDAFEGPFSIVVTIDLVLPYTPIDPAPLPSARQDRELLVAAVARWDAVRPDDYQFELAVHCECPAEVAGPFLITVREGVFASAVWAGGEGAGTPVVRSIDEAFARIGDAIGAGTAVDVTYDDDLGHPVLVIIDPEAVAVDGGLAFTMSGFQALEPLGFITGLALAGPQCPVQKSPPDPGCEDRPVAGAEVRISRSPDDSVMSVTTDRAGTFLISLEPGVYVITPQPVPGLLGTAAPVTVTVEPGRGTTVELAYDTGIR
jgi:hypothetical protein